MRAYFETYSNEGHPHTGFAPFTPGTGHRRDDKLVWDSECATFAPRLSVELSR